MIITPGENNLINLQEIGMTKDAIDSDGFILLTHSPTFGQIKGRDRNVFLKNKLIGKNCGMIGNIDSVIGGAVNRL